MICGSARGGRAHHNLGLHQSRRGKHATRASTRLVRNTNTNRVLHQGVQVLSLNEYNFKISVTDSSNMPASAKMDSEAGTTSNKQLLT